MRALSDFNLALKIGKFSLPSNKKIISQFVTFFHFQNFVAVVVIFLTELNWCQLHDSSAVETVFYHRSQQATFGHPGRVFALEKSLWSTYLFLMTSVLCVLFTVSAESQYWISFVRISIGSMCLTKNSTWQWSFLAWLSNEKYNFSRPVFPLREQCLGLDPWNSILMT